MIVDLVRNDLTKCSGSVSTKVLELAKTCSFNTIHQLITKILDFLILQQCSNEIQVSEWDISPMK